MSTHRIKFPDGREVFVILDATSDAATKIRYLDKKGFLRWITLNSEITEAFKQAIAQVERDDGIYDSI